LIFNLIFFLSFLISGLVPQEAFAHDFAIYKEAIELIKNNYYNPQVIKKSFSEYNINTCKIGLSEYDSIKCLIQKLKDPYTKFLTPKEALQESRRIRTVTAGTGIILDPLNPVIIAMVQAASPAAKAGLKSQDQLLAINDNPVELLSDQEINNFLKDLKVGQKVKIDFERGYAVYTSRLEAKEIEAISIRSKFIEQNILYVKIDDLLSNKAYDVFKSIIISQNKKTKIKGLIIDLRDNTGGLLKNAITIADYLLEKGNIVTIESLQGLNNIKAKSLAIYKGPIVILMNDQTASASEIIAAALLDNKKAISIGNRTFGKGLVQQIKVLADDSALHITVNKFYRPNGKEIHKVGIKPDMDIKDEREQLKAAIKYLRGN
jgi:carboxyl-terminal processing protease